MKIAIVIILILLGVGIFLYFFIRNKKRQSLLESYTEHTQAINKINAELIEELKRTKSISKNEESIKLYIAWSTEYESLQDRFEEINNLYAELSDLCSYKTHGEFINVSNILEGYIFEFEETFKTLFNKVKLYTQYELENTRISLTLKTRIKEIVNLFEIKLKFLEIYNNTFYSEITTANGLISEFEILQTTGNYPEGRNLLKKCNRILDDVDFTLKLILNFQEYLTQLQNDINTIYKINEEIERIGFKINVSDFETRVENYSIRRDSILERVIELNFEKALEQEHLKELESTLTSLDVEIGEFKDIVEEKFTFISEIIEIMDENTELIKTATELIEGAMVERDEIIKLYDLGEIKQIKKLDDDFTNFAQFINDYEKLMNIIHNAKEDYAKLKARITQSNQYLVRTLKNLKVSLQELKTIRNDEIEALDNLNSYETMLIEIDLYLRKYEHKEKMSKNVQTLLIELTTKLQSLKHELNQEPLNINNVRNLDASINKLIISLTDNEIEKNIKQRIGCELLIKYLNQFNTTEDNNLVIKRLQNLYNNNDYRSLLTESYGLLKLNTNSADRIYRNIVSQVEVSPFSKILHYSTPKAD